MCGRWHTTCKVQLFLVPQAAVEARAVPRGGRERGTCTLLASCNHPKTELSVEIPVS